ncbi:hypothetical protein HMPREF3181_00649 [Parvimonas sp. KA00067]|nr:hypothetical protein HMPREF3181_00649 [Parvimonas sp. KA00067]
MENGEQKNKKSYKNVKITYFWLKRLLNCMIFCKKLLKKLQFVDDFR